MRKTVIVTGGCGYIGYHIVRDLLRSGKKVVIFDTLVNSAHDKVWVFRRIENCEVHQVDVCNYKHFRAAVNAVCMSHEVEAVIHTAGYKSVEESCNFPLKYYSNNITSCINVAKCVVKYRIPTLIFSSSASVYGATATEVTEDATASLDNCKSPYACTKMMGERIFKDASKKHGFRLFNCRYSNPIGGDPRYGIETRNHNLLPALFNCAREKKTFTIFGKDYDTPDGTCIRDFIDVQDVASAHTCLVNCDSPGCDVDISSGIGKSVLQFVTEFKKHVIVDFEYADRRNGDVASLFIKPSKFLVSLGWNRKYSFEQTIRSICILCNVLIFKIV